MKEYDFSNYSRRVRLPWWGKIILGAAGLGLILWKVPLAELIALVVYCFLVPVALCTSVFTLGSGVVEMMGSTWDKVREGIREAKEEIRRQQEEQNWAHMERPASPSKPPEQDQPEQAQPAQA